MSILQVENTGISFGGLVAVDNVSFAVKPGEVFSIIGPNGAGKTTLFNIVTGVYQTDRGSVMLDGEASFRSLFGSGLEIYWGAYLGMDGEILIAGALDDVCEQIVATPDTDLTLSDWGDKLSIDPKTIQRRFARETGMTFGQWRQQARLLAALERLAAGQKVVDVALEMGYESSSAFATMFRRQFGIPPSAFFK